MNEEQTLTLDLDHVLEMVKTRKISSETAYQLIQEMQRLDGVSSEKGNIRETAYFYPSWELKPLKRSVPGVQKILLFASEWGALPGLNEHELQVVRVRPGDDFSETDNLCFEINPAHEEDYARMFKRLSEIGFLPNCIVHCWTETGFAAEEDALNGQLEKGLYSLYFICKLMDEYARERPVQLLYAYRSNDEEQPQYEGISGFLRSIRWEYPHWICRTMDAGADAGDLYSLCCQELEAEDCAVELRYRGSKRYVKRLIQINAVADQPHGWRDRGVYLITGGMGGLGLKIAAYLARTARGIVLAGRSSLNVDQQKHLHELEHLGTEICYIQSDLTRREDTERLITQCREKFGAIHGIIHAAGVLRDALLHKKTKADIAAVVNPKIYGTVWLDEASRHEKLDFFIVFSSVMSVLGNAGQCDYAFANGFMDSYCRRRDRLSRQGERNGQSIALNWPLWTEGGMRVDEHTRLFLEQTLGIKPLSDSRGVQAFEDAAALKESQLLVLEGTGAEFQRLYDKVSIKQAEALSVPAAPKQSMDDRELFIQAAQTLVAIASSILYVEEDQIDLEADKSDYGFDSISTTDFVNRINATFQIDLTPPVVFEYATLSSFTTYLTEFYEKQLTAFYGMAGKLDNAESNRSEEVHTDLLPDLEEDADVDDPIAIIGIAATMPQSDCPSELWNNLASGESMISEIPRDRWDWQQYFGDPLKEANKTDIRWGGFMKEIDKFDALFFGISPREAEIMDPRQRIYLQTVWQAIEDAGYKASDLSGSKTGMFVGVVSSDYNDLMNEYGVNVEAQTAMGVFHSILANRISYLLNLHGPSEPVDTACSGSLVAIHRAVESIRNGDCDMAIAGGISVIASPHLYIAFNKAGMLSPDGRCKTFDSKADGYVRSEGSGALVLKPLSKAQASGDHIYGVIKATAINHGGHANTLTSPNPNAQAQLIIDAWKKSGIDPRTVSYIEAHGTGTPLGDPIEINGLKKAFAQLYKMWDEQFGADLNNVSQPVEKHCAIGSVKTYIGHLEAASGIAGVMNVLLSMKHNKLLPNLQLKELNPYIQLEGSPFYIVKDAQEWNRSNKDTPRCAGVSSFGFGGVNAHVVIQEYIEPEYSAESASSSNVIVLSAKNEERLKSYAAHIAEFINSSNSVMADICFTLQTGREAMEERIAFTVSNAKEAMEKLELFALGNTDIPRFCQGRTVRRKLKENGLSEGEDNTFVTDNLIRSQELQDLARLWVSGVEIDWMQLYVGKQPQRISMPTYPFVKERHWLQAAKYKELAEDKEAYLTPNLSSLLINKSDFTKYQYSCTFTGNEFFLTDHRVKGHKVLPGVAHLELVREAVRQAANLGVNERITLQQIVWIKPITTGERVEQIKIHLKPDNDGTIDFKVCSSRAAEEGSTTVFSQGRAVVGMNTESLRIDISAVQTGCKLGILKSGECYEAYLHKGMDYGPSFRGLGEICLGSNQVLAKLSLPSGLRGKESDYVLHPSIMDAAFQATIGLWLNLPEGSEEVSMQKPLLPFSVKEIIIDGPCKPDMWAYVRFSQDGPSGGNNHIFDIDICDLAGMVSVRLRGLHFKKMDARMSFSSVNENDGYETLLLAPVWSEVYIRRVNHERERFNHRVVQGTLIAGGTEKALKWFSKYDSNALPLHLSSEDSIDSIIGKMENMPDIHHLVLLTPYTADISPKVDSMIFSQESGVILIYKLIKALLQLGYGSRRLEWTVITFRAQSIYKHDPIDPTHVGIHGLIGVMAKEQSHWAVRQADLEELDECAIADLLALPADSLGFPYVNRKREWYRQQLIQVDDKSRRRKAAYREGGVYVVIGGAGGIGEAWSEYMIRTYRAQIIWLGRRECDSDIQARIDRLGRIGRSPCYFSADATDLEAMRRVYRQIKRDFGTIQGVVHSAIVLHDSSLARMDEDSFRKALAVKVDVCVNMAQLFREDILDFVLFFSSMNTFIKSPGQGNYVAGCTFKDAFAQYLASQWDCQVKVMNWGYWGSVGSVSSDRYRIRMEKAGHGSIETPEAMAALEILLGGTLDQLALLKRKPSLYIDGINEEETIIIYEDNLPSLIP
ncbi:type I polyketide synthase [Paenibacillus durus]|uniref:type I polyketide synthase n=1 Tax=Paenibacillus durus TaxID=44251 RepID=UPI0006949F0D|nr:type I polyketide synthase [Paenibacillus durus]